MPFFAFLISISNVYAVDGDDAGDKDVDVDIDEGEGSTGTGNCSSLNNTVCRASGNSSYPQYLYASLTNPATKSNGVVVASSNSKVENDFNNPIAVFKICSLSLLYCSCNNIISSTKSLSYLYSFYHY